MYRISELIKSERQLYHSNDLAILWNISNRNTLYTTIKRYVQKGVLIPIYKGLYSTVPIEQLDPIDLGKAVIHRFTYLTTESVLSLEGIITQTIYAYTFVSDQSKKVSVGNWSFLFRRLKDEYLYNPEGVVNRNGNFIATTERAVADMLYFNPKYHFDLADAIDFERVAVIQRKVGYK